MTIISNTISTSKVATIFVIMMCIVGIFSCDSPQYLNPYDPEWEMNAADWAPNNLRAAAVGDYAIKLVWVNKCNFETKFVIERSQNENDFSILTEIDNSLTSYYDTTCHKNMKYFYRIKAIAPNNEESSYSIIAHATVIDDDLIFIEGGTFSMGSTEGYADEKPVHSVKLHDFYVGKYEITHSEFIIFLNNVDVLSNGVLDGQELIDMDDSGCAIQYSGSYFYFSSNNIATNVHSPVIEITWYGAISYCNWLSKSRGLDPVYIYDGSVIIMDITSNGYRIPTEAEWEYAARGGLKSLGYNYSGSNTCDDVSWYYDNSCSAGADDLDFGIHTIGRKNPNELGIHDMSGNVYEWCWDWYGSNYYSNISGVNPHGPETGNYRVVRGGGWSNSEDECRTTSRLYAYPGTSYDNLGFRICRTSE